MNKEQLAQIRKNIKADARTPTTWARLRGFPVQVVISLLAGFYNPETKTAKAVLARLREDGYYPPELDEAA